MNEPAKGGLLLLAGLIGRLSCDEALLVSFHGPDDSLLAPCIELPISRNGTFREFLPVPKGTTCLGIEPQGGEREMRFARVSLERVSELERILLMLDRVWRFKREALLEIPLSERLPRLEDLYLAVRESRVLWQKLDPYEVYLEQTELIQIGAAQRLHETSDELGRRVHFAIFLSGQDADGAERTKASLVSQIYPDWSLATSENWPTPATVDQDLWIVPMRGGDTLRIDALVLLAWEIRRHSEACVVYSDHDFMDPIGRRHSPSFKPDWNEDLFYTHDYVDALCAIQNAAWEQHGFRGQNPVVSESRATFLLKMAREAGRSIRHLSQVLCHRCSPLEDSVCLGGCFQARAIEEYLAPRGGEVVPGPISGTARVLWPLPSAPPLVSIIIATRDHGDILEACVRSIQTKTTYVNWELLILDNQSTDPATKDYLREVVRDSRIRVYACNMPFNYSAIQNFGVARSRGEVLAFLNNDVEVIAPGWLEDMVRQVMRPEVGAVGARLLYSDGRIQHAGVVLGIGGVAGHVHRFAPADAPGYGGRILLAHQLSAVTAACIAVRRGAFLGVGGFDERHLTVALNDVDLCLKLVESGLKNIYEPAALLYHHESLSRGVDDTPRKRRIFHRERSYMRNKWGEMLRNDPHYSPHLSMEREDYSVRLPGEKR